jgi:hypothetical protein
MIMVSPISRSPYLTPFMWPLLAAASASGATASFLSQLAGSWGSQDQDIENTPEPSWATRNAVALELPSLRFNRSTAVFLQL